MRRKMMGIVLIFCALLSIWMLSGCKRIDPAVTTAAASGTTAASTAKVDPPVVTTAAASGTTTASTAKVDPPAVTTAAANGTTAASTAKVDPPASAIGQTDIYVDPNASAGGNGTVHAPVRTLDEAVAAAKNAYAADSDTAVIIHLADGTHRVGSTVSFKRTDIKGALTITGSENAVISGNMPIDSSAFTKVAGKEYYVAQLDKDVGGHYPNFRYLYVNGEIATLAKEGYDRYADAAAAGTTPWVNGAIDKTTAKFYVDAEVLENVSAEDLVGAEIHLAVEWEFKIMHIRRVDPSDKDENGRIAIYLEPSDFNIIFNTRLSWQNRYYWFENGLGLLNEPGEYYYDRTSGKLYYMPKDGEDIARSAFAYPMVEQLLCFEMLEDVTLENFTVTGCDNRWVERVGYYGGNQAGHTAKGLHETSAIYGKHANGMTVKNVTVKNVAGDGIQLRGRLENITVDSCTFTGIGATAIRVGDLVTWSSANYLKNCSIHNNYIDGAAWYFRQNCAVFVSIAKDMTIDRNTIKNCSYTGISVGYSWETGSKDPAKDNWCNLYNVEIAYNYFENYLTDMSDGGAIYTLGGNGDPATYQDVYFNTMHHNYAVVNANTGAGKGRFMTLYHDGASSNWHSYSNVIATCEGNHGLGDFYIQVAQSGQDPKDFTSQQARNILAEKNYFLYANFKVAETIGKTTVNAGNAAAYIQRVIFANTAQPNYRTLQKNNYLLAAEADIPAECRAIMDGAGNQ